MATDWGAWSRDAVALMQRRNDEWMKRFGLGSTPYRWFLDEGKIVFSRSEDQVVADLCLIGTASSCQGTFLWSWANEGIPAAARQGLEAVREFGQEHDLSLLVDAEWPGGRAEGLEMVAVASRILHAEGCWIDTVHDLTMFFALRNFRIELRR